MIVTEKTCLFSLHLSPNNLYKANNSFNFIKKYYYEKDCSQFGSFFFLSEWNVLYHGRNFRESH